MLSFIIKSQDFPKPSIHSHNPNTIAQKKHAQNVNLMLLFGPIVKLFRQLNEEEKNKVKSISQISKHFDCKR